MTSEKITSSRTRERLRLIVAQRYGGVDATIVRHLADSTGVSFTTLARYLLYPESTRFLTRATLARLARALDTRIDWLESGEGIEQAGLWLSDPKPRQHETHKGVPTRPLREFDVFICYNSLDRSSVSGIVRQLQDRGVRVWMDVNCLRPGFAWQQLVEEQIQEISSAAVFVGDNGVGPWQNQEINALMRQFVARGCPVIPVLLASASARPSLPPFLAGMTWVDFRENDPDPMTQLIWGITGQKAP